MTNLMADRRKQEQRKVDKESKREEKKKKKRKREILVDRNERRNARSFIITSFVWNERENEQMIQ